jgi:hypothetical protein
MPIFMDRHDMRDTTAEAIAAAHRRDLDVQRKYGVKYMTYWFDQDRGTGFCLVDAPDAATAEQVHREAHGEIPPQTSSLSTSRPSKPFSAASAIPMATHVRRRRRSMPVCAP